MACSQIIRCPSSYAYEPIMSPFCGIHPKLSVHFGNIAVSTFTGGVVDAKSRVMRILVLVIFTGHL
jgi:hypothetical protein